MSFYRKRPVVIEARQLTDETMWEIWDWLGGAAKEWCWDDDEKSISIITLEGRMLALCGDWIIRGVKGEFYPCKPDVFSMSYEPAGESRAALAWLFI